MRPRPNVTDVDAGVLPSPRFWAAGLGRLPSGRRSAERLLHQISASDDDFGEIIGGLLSIQGTLGDRGSGARARGEFADADISPQETGNVISGYLERALGMMAV